jgi:hypothetical protein
LESLAPYIQDTTVTVQGGRGDRQLTISGGAVTLSEPEAKSPPQPQVAQTGNAGQTIANIIRGAALGRPGE